VVPSKQGGKSITILLLDALYQDQITGVGRLGCDGKTPAGFTGTLVESPAIVPRPVLGRKV
jgi:hypothetical protein